MPLQGTRPYFIRAIHEWLVDAGQTPHVLVDVHWPGAALPAIPAEEGRLVFNIAPSAVRDLHLGNEELAFSARFSGAAQYVRIPIGAVLGIYARESGDGLFFDPADYPRPPSPAPTAGPQPPAGKPGPGPRPGLRVVK